MKHKNDLVNPWRVPVMLHNKFDFKNIFPCEHFFAFCWPDGAQSARQKEKFPSLYTLIIAKHFEFPSRLFSLLPSTTSFRNRFHHHFALVPLPQRTAFHLILVRYILQ